MVFRDKLSNNLYRIFSGNKAIVFLLVCVVGYHG